MKRSFRSLVGFGMLMVFLITGCDLSHPGAARFQLTNPHNLTTYPLGAAVTVQYNGLYNLDNNQVSFDVEILDNGVGLGHVYYPGPHTVNGSWTIPHETPGVHWISAQARGIAADHSHTQWLSAGMVCIYVGPLPTGSTLSSACTLAFEQYLLALVHGSLYGQSSSPQQVAATVTAAPTSTPIPNPIDSVQAYPNPIYYGDTCPSLANITFRAALTLPAGTTPDLADVEAHVSVVIGPAESNAGNLIVPLLPNGTTDTASGGVVFLGTVALTHPYNQGSDHFDPASLGGSPGALLWYADVSSHDPSNSTAAFLGRSANQVLDLSPCPVSGQNPAHNSTGGGAPTGCGQYTNQTSCNLGGCSWNSQNSSCTVNP